MFKYVRANPCIRGIPSSTQNDTRYMVVSIASNSNRRRKKHRHIHTITIGFRTFLKSIFSFWVSNGQIVAAIFLCDFTKSTESLVVICSKVIFKRLNFFTNQDNSKSRNLFSRSYGSSFS